MYNNYNILNILGAVGLTATSTTSLISCEKPNNSENGGVINQKPNHNKHQLEVIEYCKLRGIIYSLRFNLYTVNTKS
ncbi:lipoprotein [Spiroplasma endosymbiont of Polydrusus cervinus]|uniref:lipoprotein n=1 Tax=Spiroplasma endosymbiont of Polydrusus cervinus TaxID=3066287 RepID=UPI0030CA6E38